jgi:putative drug exporter of the RND superfamily
MTGPLYHLGRFCSRHHWLVIGAWIVLAAALALAARAAGDRTTDNLTLPGTGSTRATDLLEQRLPKEAYGTNPVTLQVQSGKLTDEKNERAVDDTVGSLKKTPHVVDAVNPLKKAGKDFLSKDKRTAYIPVTLDVGPADISKDEAQAVLDAAQPARDAGINVALGSYAGQQLSKPSTHDSEVIGLTAAVIILLFAFGTATAMGLPIVTALLGLVSALSVVTLLGHLAEVPTVAPTLATMIGLGVGIDYALFIVTRHKLQLRDGMEMRESIARATATAGGAVVFAGGTVVIALVSLMFAGIPLVSTLGYTAAVAVVLAVLAATTLLPALLGALGPRINSLRVKLGRTHPDDHRPHGWARWARGVAARPWRSLVAGVLVLAVLATPVLDLRLGQNDVGALPESTTARQAYDALSEGFGAGANGPLLLAAKLGSPAKPDQKKLNQVEKKQKQLQKQEQQQIAQLEAQGVPPEQAKQQVQSASAKQENQLKKQRKELDTPATDPRLTGLHDDVQKTAGVKSVSPPVVDPKGNAAVFTAIPTTAPSSTKTEDLVHHLRDSVVPKATKGTDMTVTVGGQTAGYVDLAERIGEKLPSMIAIVVGLSFLVLLLAFRSLLVPLKAAVANLLSVAAAYGVVTFVFQEGHGATLIGLDGAIPIVSFVPLLMFAILFGLSMDYEVFLLTQMREHFTETGDAKRAVVDGLASTGRIITSAALIMVCVFTSFVLNGDPVVKQFGVGLAVAIAIDATIVRCLVVPAVMVLFGKASWWLPGWLGRLVPRISIEGEDYFARRPLPEPGAAGRAVHG